MTATIDVDGPINRVLNRAFSRFDDAVDRLSTQEERARRLAASAEAARADHPAFAAGYVYGALTRALTDLANALAAGFQAGRELR